MIERAISAAKRVWHLLFTDRTLAYRTSRWINLYVCWHPYWGAGLDAYVEFVPWHNPAPPTVDSERDSHWNAEFKAGLGLLWLDIGINIPNDDHPDNAIKHEPRQCPRCGHDTDLMIADKCQGCGKVTAACLCESRDGC